MKPKPPNIMNKLNKMLSVQANVELAKTMQKNDNALYSEDYFRAEGIDCPWKMPIVQKISTDTYLPNTRKELWALADRKETNAKGETVSLGFGMSHRVGTASADYQPIHNTEFVAMLRAAMVQTGLEPKETKILSSLSGSRFRYEAYIENQNVKALKETGEYRPEVGDELGFKLITDNSYDGTGRPRLAYTLHRVWCKNGCASFSRWQSEMHKHTGGIEIGVFRNELKSILSALETDAYIIRKLKEIKIDQKEGQRFIEKLIADVLKLNQTDSTAMRLHWQRPDTGIEREFRGHKLDGEAGNDRNAWQVFNAATRVLSSEKTAKTIEARESTNSRLSSIFAGFANDPETIAEWTTFEPFKREKVDGKIKKVRNLEWKENWQNSVLDTVVA